MEAHTFTPVFLVGLDCHQVTLMSNLSAPSLALHLCSLAPRKSPSSPALFLFGSTKLPAIPSSLPSVSKEYTHSAVRSKGRMKQHLKAYLGSSKETSFPSAFHGKSWQGSGIP